MSTSLELIFDALYTLEELEPGLVSEPVFDSVSDLACILLGIARLDFLLKLLLEAPMKQWREQQQNDSYSGCVQSADLGQNVLEGLVLDGVDDDGFDGVEGDLEEEQAQRCLSVLPHSFDVDEFVVGWVV